MLSLPLRTPCPGEPMPVQTLPAEPLSSDFFEQDTLSVAQALLGCRLWRYWAPTGQWLGFRVVETEAYTQEDPACHAYGRRAGRAATLYGAPGLAYVYLIYGMYDCLNVVTEPEGRAGAVLFRALEPLLPGHEHPRQAAVYRTHGPGRLTRSLQITRAQHNGVPLFQPESGLVLTPGEPGPVTHVVTTTRIGIRQAADYPWRFYLADSPWVSVRDREAEVNFEQEKRDAT